MYANDSCHFMAARPWFTERPLLPCQLDWRQAFSCKLWAGCANQKWCDCYFQSPSFSFMLQCHWRSEKGERFISSFNWSTCWFSIKAWKVNRLKDRWLDNKTEDRGESKRARGKRKLSPEKVKGYQLAFCAMCLTIGIPVSVIIFIKLNSPRLKQWLLMHHFPETASLLLPLLTYFATTAINYRGRKNQFTSLIILLLFFNQTLNQES